MSINFRVIQRGEPGVTGGGEKKFYASTASSGEVNLEKLTKIIEKISTVSGADVRAVLYALVDVIRLNLEDGQIVRLGDLGSMRVTISSEGHLKGEDVTAASIKGAKTIFSPGPGIKEMLNNLKYTKVVENNTAVPTP